MECFVHHWRVEEHTSTLRLGIRAILWAYPCCCNIWYILYLRSSFPLLCFLQGSRSHHNWPELPVYPQLQLFSSIVLVLNTLYCQSFCLQYIFLSIPKHSLTKIGINLHFLKFPLSSLLSLQCPVRRFYSRLHHLSPSPIFLPPSVQ